MFVLLYVSTLLANSDLFVVEKSSSAKFHGLPLRRFETTHCKYRFKPSAFLLPIALVILIYV